MTVSATARGGRVWGLMTAALAVVAAASAGGADRTKTEEEVEFAKKLGRDVVDKLDRDAFLKKHPKARRNPRDSDPGKGVAAYDLLLESYVFRDGKLISKSFTIPRTEEGFAKHHPTTLEKLGKPDHDLLTDDERRKGVLHNSSWYFRECDLLIHYVVEKRGREYHQIFNIGSFKALGDLDK